MHPHPAKVSSKTVDSGLVSIMLHLSLFDPLGVGKQPIALLLHLLHRLVVAAFEVRTGVGGHQSNHDGQDDVGVHLCRNALFVLNRSSMLMNTIACMMRLYVSGSM